MMAKEKTKKSKGKEETKKRDIVIPGEILVSGNDYLPGENTKREGKDIISLRFGLFDKSERLIKVIPLSGAYIPRRGNTVIGKVIDIMFNGWLMEINAPYPSFLPVSEYPRYVNKNDLAECYDIGDMVVCKVANVKRKGIDLTVKGRGLGRVEEGIIIYINSHKVPRVIGKEGSMINLIKKETGCNIVVGQNGVIWIEGKNIEDELFAKKAIMFVVKKSYIEGLTEKVQEWFNKNKKDKGEK
jgi:exosome complex component RRP4